MTERTPAEAAQLRRLVEAALEEDVGPGDWTTVWTVPPEVRGRAVVEAREPLVVAGLEAARTVFRILDSGLDVEAVVRDGERVAAGDVILRLSGPLASILTGERTALNFLSRLSGIATLTRRFVEVVEGTGVRILDTRKTTPGWRFLEKAAVRAGGGENHRMGLHDMVLVKDNHIEAAGGVREAVRRVLERNRDGLPVEVEVASLEELEAVVDLPVDRILLDNMPPRLLREAVVRVRRREAPRPLLEASGNVTLETVRAVAETGVDLVSVGALTHSARGVDLSLRILDGRDGADALGG